MSEETSQLLEMREFAIDSAEQFKSLSSMIQLVEQTLAPRFDESGRLLPLKERRTLSNSEYLRKPLPTVQRTDLVVGPKNQVISDPDGGEIRSGWGYNVNNALYSALTQKEQVALSASDIDRLTAEKLSFIHLLDNSSQYTGRFDDISQLTHAFHINRTTRAPDEGKDIAGNLRVYLHGGIEGIRIARRMIENGVDFDFAKVWTPDLVEGSQGFRRDTPIFEASNLSQLQSIVVTLRKLKDEGELPEYDKLNPLAGLPVDGLPGVYVGQILSGRSFNSMMKGLFAEPVHNAVLAATNQTPLHVGEKPPEGWFEKVAIMARKEALEKAITVDINPQYHALIREQDPKPVMDILRQSAQ